MNSEMFNPAARDGVFTWVGLRLIPVTMALAFIFSVVLP